MTAAPHRCDVVHLINARREKITACNSVFAPASHARELAEAAPFWTDENAPTRVDAPEWQWRDSNGRIIRKSDSLPPILSQREIDAVNGHGIAAWLVMFAATTAVVAIITAFDWLVGAM